MSQRTPSRLSSIGDRVAVFWDDCGTGDKDASAGGAAVPGWLPGKISARPGVDAPSLRRRRRGMYKCSIRYDDEEDEDEEQEDPLDLLPHTYLTSIENGGKRQAGVWVKLAEADGSTTTVMDVDMPAPSDDNSAAAPVADPINDGSTTSVMGVDMPAPSDDNSAATAAADPMNESTCT